MKRKVSKSGQEKPRKTYTVLQRSIYFARKRNKPRIPNLSTRKRPSGKAGGVKEEEKIIAHRL